MMNVKSVISDRLIRKSGAPEKNFVTPTTTQLSGNRQVRRPNMYSTIAERTASGIKTRIFQMLFAKNTNNNAKRTAVVTSG